MNNFGFVYNFSDILFFPVSIVMKMESGRWSQPDCLSLNSQFVAEIS